MPQGGFTPPEDGKLKWGPRAACRVGIGGKDPLMLDNALAMVDNFVSMKLDK